MKRDVGPFLRAIADVIFAVAAFFAPWLHLALFSSNLLSALNFDKVTIDFLFVILPIPLACFAAIFILNFSEKPSWKRPAICFLSGAALYFPVFLFLIYWRGIV